MVEPPGEASSIEQVEAVRRVVQAVLAEEKQATRADNSALEWLLDAIKTYWPVFVGLVTVGLGLAAWLLLDVSPLDSAKEIAQRKQQHKYQQELARRHVDLGNDFLNVGQPKAAEAEFTQAKQLDSYNADADLGLLKVSVFATVFEQEYDPEVVERQIHMVLQQKPKDTHALAVLGSVYSTIDPQKSSEYYDEAIASDKNNALAYAGKAYLAMKRGDRQTALAMYEVAINLSPWNQTFLNNAAYQYYLNSNYSKAEELYVRLLNLQPDFLLSYSMLANTQLILGNAVLADSNLEPLDEKLRDQSILKLQRNQGGWEYQVRNQNKPVTLYSQPEKVAYLRYLLALARQLTRHHEAAIRALQEVAAESHDTSQARLIIDSDISNLADARPEFAKQLREFRLSLGVKRSFR
jgi:tetratricopeptide (TPR) repeat protein